MTKSRYLSQEIAKRYFGRRDPWELPETWVGLFAVLPNSPSDAGTEVSGAGYVRRQVINEFEGWLLPDEGDWRRQNAAALYFGPAGATWSVVGFGIWDAPSGGHLLHYAPLATSRTVYSGNGLSLPAGALVLTPSVAGNGGPVGLEYAVGGWASDPPGRWWIEVLTTLTVSAAFTPRPDDPTYTAARFDNSLANWPIVDGEVVNGAPITFPEASVDWPDVLGVGFFDISTKSLWWIAALTAAVSVRKGERFEIPAGTVLFRDL